MLGGLLGRLDGRLLRVLAISLDDRPNDLPYWRQLSHRSHYTPKQPDSFR